MIVVVFLYMNYLDIFNKENRDGGIIKQEILEKHKKGIIIQ